MVTPPPSRSYTHNRPCGHFSPSQCHHLTLGEMRRCRKTVLTGGIRTGTTPAEQSVLVHEMVHHLQNLGKVKFECPMAREKLAYMAQDQWLKRFGKDLETEFEVDMFTVLVSSSCMF